MQLPEDVCKLDVGMQDDCPGCDGSPVHTITGTCPDCKGNGRRSYSLGECYACKGLGVYGYGSEQRACSRCGGLGQFHPWCLTCTGSGRVETGQTVCDQCGGQGRVPIAQVIAATAPAEYVHRMAEIMIGCTDENEGYLLERADKLYHVLRETYRVLLNRYTDRRQLLFNQELENRIRSARETLKKKLNIL